MRVHLYIPTYPFLTILEACFFNGHTLFKLELPYILAWLNKPMTTYMSAYNIYSSIGKR
jgi:hypothetical protein